jgi:hypothetical protein
MNKEFIYKVSSLLCACLSFVACSQVEDVDYEVGTLQPLVISAIPVETRTMLADDGKTIHWQADDEIAVYDYNAPKHRFALESFDKSKARFLGKIKLPWSQPMLSALASPLFRRTGSILT